MQIYKFLSRGIGPRLFVRPEDFLAACIKYFEWVDDHPLREEQLFSYKGSITRADASRMRAYTKTGLATYLGIPVSRLDAYKARDEQAWKDAVEIVEQIIYEQKFTGAAAGLLNSMMITRDLGLADKQEVDNKTTVVIDGDEAGL